MISFSNQAKAEICAAVRKPADRKAFLTGVLLTARRITPAEIVMQTECEALAAMLPQLIAAVSPKTAWDTEFRTRSEKQPVWCFRITGHDAAVLLQRVGLSGDRQAFLAAQHGRAFAMLAAGCFVMCGNVTNPERRYHLEMVMPDEAFGVWLREQLCAEQPSIVMKQTQRKGDMVLYLKQNEQICDAMTYFGAQNATLALIEQQVFKSVRSNTNRQLNCDMANIEKTVAAGAQQVADIALIAERMGLDELPETLQEIAQLRLREQDANLRDLGVMCDPPLSRSGVHHRLQRLSAIAEKLRNQEK